MYFLMTPSRIIIYNKKKYLGEKLREDGGKVKKY